MPSDTQKWLREPTSQNASVLRCLPAAIAVARLERSVRFDHRGRGEVHAHDHRGRAALAREPLDERSGFGEAGALAADLLRTDEAEHAVAGERLQRGGGKCAAIDIGGVGGGKLRVLFEVHDRLSSRRASLRASATRTRRASCPFSGGTCGDRNRAAWEDPERVDGSKQMTPSLRDAIADRLRDPEDVVLARDILGTADPDAIARQVEAFVPGVTGCPLFIQSVGAVFVLDRGAERVVVKVHQFGARLRDFETLDEIEAAYAAQAALASAGLPCARVVAPPRMFTPRRAAAMMSYVEVAPIDDPHAPATAPALAAMAARISAVLAEAPEGARLRSRTRLPATLYPPAHNALFDLHRTGGEWIDERAARARAVLERGVSPAVMHSDVSLREPPRRRRAGRRDLRRRQRVPHRRAALRRLDRGSLHVHRRRPVAVGRAGVGVSVAGRGARVRRGVRGRSRPAVRPRGA